MYVIVNFFYSEPAALIHAAAMKSGLPVLEVEVCGLWNRKDLLPEAALLASGIKLICAYSSFGHGLLLDSAEAGYLPPGPLSYRFCLKPTFKKSPFQKRGIQKILLP
jgi:hypothetical protein